jgi:hypothetical protein
MLPYFGEARPPPHGRITNPPYIWLPTVMVAFAILGHIVVYRRLRAAADSRHVHDAAASGGAQVAGLRAVSSDAARARSMSRSSGFEI